MNQNKLSLNLLFPFAAIISIFVLFIILQIFIYQPFVRGDSWVYVGTSVSIDKGGYGVFSSGHFQVYSALHLFETVVSAVFGLSGFPPVNSVMVIALVVAFLMPLGFYAMSIKYTQNLKVQLLGCFIFVVCSGFGWIPFVGQKLLTGASYSLTELPMAIERFAPAVLFDITQPHGVLSEGVKTYAFGLLAIMMLLYLFKSEMHTKPRVALIALIVAFAFEVHIEEAIIFSVAFIPVLLFAANGRMLVFRQNIVGTIIGLGTVTLFDYLLYPAKLSSTISLVTIATLSLVTVVVLLGYIFPLSYVNLGKIKIIVRKILAHYRLPIFLIASSIFLVSILVLVLFGYPNMSFDNSIKVVHVGFSFPWYYYPMSLGITGVFLLAGLLMRFYEYEKISYLLFMVVALAVFGFLISLFNENFVLTGTKEWRVIYRVMPIPASLFAGWVLYKILQVLEKGRSLRQFGVKLHKYQFGSRILAALLLLSVIILGIPSTIIASEYWMSTDMNSNGSIHPKAADIELANFFANIPLNATVGVFSSGSNAMVQLGGARTVMPRTYPNLSNVSRPENVPIFSSEADFIVLDKTRDLGQDFSYLPVVFNNSKYIVYRMPYLQSPAIQSPIGYLVSSQYNERTLPSFSIMSSLNYSCELINNEIEAKSVLVLPSIAPGQFILSLNGVNEDVDLGNYTSAADEFTVCAWFRTSAMGSDMSLVNKRLSGPSQAGYRIVISSDDRISAEINDGNGTFGVTGGIHNDNLWHNVVSVFGQRYLSLYVDGKLEGITEMPRRLGSITNDLDLTLGSENGERLFFNGSISNVCIYDRSISETEINRNILSFDSYPFEGGLRLWLPINEGFGKPLGDGIDHVDIGSVHGSVWNYETIPSRVSYNVNTESIMSWVNNGGKLLILGGRGEMTSALGLIDTYGYSNVNSVGINSEEIQFNETISIKPFTYYTNTTVLGYYKFGSENICPFAAQIKHGQGSIIYFNIDPIYQLANRGQGGLLLNSEFISLISEALVDAN